MGTKASKAMLPPQTLKDLQNHVDFSPEEIRNWYEEYQQSLRPGQKELTKNEFKKVYNSVFAGDATDFAEHVFRTFDSDKSGKVDFKEFLVGLYVSGSTDDLDANLKWAFSMYDINGDGYITWDEMRHIISAIFKMTCAQVPSEVNTPDKMTDKLFPQFDMNNDGLISYREFYAGATQNPIIINLLQCNPGTADSPVTPVSPDKNAKFTFDKTFELRHK